MSKILKPYAVGVVDIGSPRLGNLGWCLSSGKGDVQGDCLDRFAQHMAEQLSSKGCLLGLEAPLFVPLRSDIMLATKGRKGEGNRPWSGGAGAQVLAMNLPIMIYLFKKIYEYFPEANFIIDEHQFTATASQVLIFEALVSGKDKGNSHIEDAKIMTDYCLKFSEKGKLPPTILEHEEKATFFNLAASALLRCGFIRDITWLSNPNPIYKPSF